MYQENFGEDANLHFFAKGTKTPEMNSRAARTALSTKTAGATEVLAKAASDIGKLFFNVAGVPFDKTLSKSSRRTLA